MKTIRTTPDSNGAYPAIQNWPGRAIPDGYAQWPDSLPTAVFEQYNGIVTLTIQRRRVTACEPNTEAWQAWNESKPDEPEPGDMAAENAKLRAQLESVSEDITNTQMGLVEVYELMLGG